MRMPKVDNFLGCMKLETGGLVIGWLNAVGNVLALIAGVFVLVMVGFIDCEELKQLLEVDEIDTGLDKSENLLCSIGVGLVIFASIFLIVIAIGCFVISYFCIRGTHRRNHIHVKPMMVLMGIVTVLSFLELLSSNGKLIGAELIEMIWYGYSFIVLYSLHSKFQEEFEHGSMAQYWAVEKV